MRGWRPGPRSTGRGFEAYLPPTASTAARTEGRRRHGLRRQAEQHQAPGEKEKPRGPPAHNENASLGGIVHLVPRQSRSARLAEESLGVGRRKLGHGNPTHYRLTLRLMARRGGMASTRAGAHALVAGGFDTARRGGRWDPSRVCFFHPLPESHRAWSAGGPGLARRRQQPSEGTTKHLFVGSTARVSVRPSGVCVGGGGKKGAVSRTHLGIPQ